jgi:peptide/nickel transport system permease protein
VLVVRPLARHVLGLAVTVWASTVVIFGALSLAPGSPIAFLSGGRTLSPQQKAALRAYYHLNDPIWTRYWRWLTGLLHGNLGESLAFREPVTTVLGPRLETTLFLVVYAGFLIVAAGVVLGVVAARAPRGVDAAITALTTVGLATPAFVAAVGLTLVFAVRLAWFPVFGSGSGFAGRLEHLTLPAIALAIGGVALIARITRAAVRTELASEHVETARSRGLSELRVLRRHAVRNALIPVTTAAGLTVGSLLAGTTVVETAFGIDGGGSLLVQSVEIKDFPVVQAVCLLLVVAFAVINTCVDLLYTVIDPRIRRAAA